MQRWPTQNGLVLPIEEVGYERVPQERRRTQRHHLYFQKSWYSDRPVQHLFRNLVDHVVDMSIHDHEELHQRFRGPLRPPDGLMVDVLDEYMALNGVIECVKERKTGVTYQVDQDLWSQIRDGNARSNNI